MVDNGSLDQSQTLVEKYRFTNYQLIQNKHNLGFAEANNQGYEKARGGLILLLNNDTEVSPDLLDILVSKIQSNSGIGVVQPKILIMDRPDHLDSVGSFLTKTGFLQHVGYLKRDTEEYQREREIFSAKGACMLIKKEVIKKTGLFDREYVSYLEETDFCWRVWLAGYKIIYYPKAFIYHKVGFTSKKLNQLSVNYHAFKNRLATLFKNLGFMNLLFIGSVHLITILALSLYYLLRLHPKESVVIWRAIGWNLTHLVELVKKRNRVQKIIRLKSDSVIFKSIMQRCDYKDMLDHFLRSQKMLSGQHEV